MPAKRPTQPRGRTVEAVVERFIAKVAARKQHAPNRADLYRLIRAERTRAVRIVRDAAKWKPSVANPGDETQLLSEYQAAELVAALRGDRARKGKRNG